MHIYIKNTFLVLIAISFSLFFISCKGEFDDDDYSAYFHGEIMNAQEDFILLCKDTEVIDTIYLDEENKFFKKFDYLEPGMYVYKNNPEFQYVYFEKNDSLYLRLNAYNFDSSIIFLGRGSEKNNFLMDLNNINESDRQKMYPEFDNDATDFIRNIDSSHAERTKFYLRNKNEIKWSDDFDLYAKNMLDLHYYLKKEIYPIAHGIRNNENTPTELPDDYYDFRKNIDLNNEKLNYFTPFSRYLIVMINSVVDENNYTSGLDLDKQIQKLNVVDSLIHNEKIKNTMLNNLAFVYLLQDKNIDFNNQFLKRYFELSTDNSQNNEIIQIQKSISKLQKQDKLPDVKFIDTKDNEVCINKIINKPTIIHVWSKHSLFHFEATRVRAREILEKNPNISIISINLDHGQVDDWKYIVKEYSHPKIIDLRVVDFKDIKDKWIINKIYRTLLVNANGSINNAFVNLFDSDIVEKLLENQRN